MGNMKFYPDNVADFTLSAVTDTESGYPKENMLDRRKATYWQADNATGIKNIDIDLGAARAVDYVLARIYDDAGTTVKIYADTNSDYSTEQQISMTATSGSTGWKTPTGLQFTEETSYRYWRIKIDPVSVAPRCALINIGSTYEITVNPEWNYLNADKDYSGVKLLESYGGQRAAVKQSDDRQVWDFFYNNLDTTNKEKFDSVLAIVNGRQYPLFFKDIEGDYNYVRLMLNALDARKIITDYYSIPVIRIEEEL